MPRLLVALTLTVAGFEAGNPSASVHNLLFAGVERMAGRADIDAHLTRGQSGTSFEGIATGSSNCGRHVFGVDSLFHWTFSFGFWGSRVQNRFSFGEPEPRKIIAYLKKISELYILQFGNSRLLPHTISPRQAIFLGNFKVIWPVSPKLGSRANRRLQYAKHERKLRKRR